MEGNNDLEFNQEVVNDHFHNREWVWGVAAVPTASHFADHDSLTKFSVASGAGVFGAVTNIIGKNDTPAIVPGSIYFDARRLIGIVCTSATAFIIRFIWGTASQTEAAAEAANQYTETGTEQPSVAGLSLPQEVTNVRVPTGGQLWAKCLNATGGATVSFLLTTHEYPSPSP